MYREDEGLEAACNVGLWNLGCTRASDAAMSEVSQGTGGPLIIAGRHIQEGNRG